MKKLLTTISYTGLAFTFLPSILVLKGVVTLQNHFWLMGVGMILWFASAPFWMRSKSLDETEEE
ncbi:hypothetical protein [Maribellus sediminis]|uniref:hypothetical protein n=1 Tax=Maribellus sediminis TaxID=2696285 RepID=UPI00197FDE4D|nr:hypothetical protein [Maribellus sediminis]